MNNDSFTLLYNINEITTMPGFLAKFEEQLTRIESLGLSRRCSRQLGVLNDPSFEV